jgi:hypothetical protein
MEAYANQFVGPQRPTVARVDWEERHGGVVGPGSYNAVNSFGKQCLAGKQTVSSFSFGAPTQKDGRGYVVGTQIRSETPGPGQYRSPGAVGPQVILFVIFPPEGHNYLPYLGCLFEKLGPTLRLWDKHST